MSGLQMLGAIAGGIRQGRDNVDRKRKEEEDRAFLQKQRAYQQQVMDRESERMTTKDRLDANMASELEKASASASESGKAYVVPGMTGANMVFDDPNKARAFKQSADGIASSMTGGQPEQPLLGGNDKLMPAMGGTAPSQQPAQRAAVKPVNGVPMPDMSETKGAAAMKLPTRPDGSLDIQEVVRPKRTADALFYHGPWQSKLRAEYAKVNGYEAAMAMDSKLKSAADTAFNQRILEAAELQKAGDMRAAALKLNEIYNRDYVDGAFSNVRFVDDNTIEVVRFLPDGRIVDRTVQPMPDMITMARGMLTPEKRAELITGSGKKEKPMVFTDEATGQAVLYDHTTGAQETLQGLKPNSMVLGEQNLQLRRQESAERSVDRAADNARADRADARAGKKTEAQVQADKLRDAKIRNARKEFSDWQKQRAAEGRSTKVMPGHPMEKTATLAKEPLTTEVQ